MLGQKPHLGTAVTNLPEKVEEGLDAMEQLAEAVETETEQENYYTQGNKLQM